jgi:hypothetical protein
MIEDSEMDRRLTNSYEKNSGTKNKAAPKVKKEHSPRKMAAPATLTPLFFSWMK